MLGKVGDFNITCAAGFETADHANLQQLKPRDKIFHIGTKLFYCSIRTLNKVLSKNVGIH